MKIKIIGCVPMVKGLKLSGSHMDMMRKMTIFWPM